MFACSVWKMPEMWEKKFINPFFIEKDPHFFCQICSTYTKWTFDTLLAKTQLHFQHICMLISLFVDGNNVEEADYILGKIIIELHVNTIRKYYELFSHICLVYYQTQLRTLLLEGEIELDESHLYNTKKSKAPHRPYAYGDIWLFGLKERKHKRFIITPVTKRDESTLIN